MGRDFQTIFFVSMKSDQNELLFPPLFYLSTKTDQNEPWFPANFLGEHKIGSKRVAFSRHFSASAENRIKMSRKFPPKLRPHVNKRWPPKCKQEDAIAVSDPSISFVHFSIFWRNPILTLSYVRSTFYSHSPALTPILTNPKIRKKYTPPPRHSCHRSQWSLRKYNENACKGIKQMTWMMRGGGVYSLCILCFC